MVQAVAMANSDHVVILRQGVAAWNAWRENYPNIEPDLTEVDLSGLGLRGANLYKSKLSRSNLRRCDLSNAFLRKAVLDEADLSDGDLTEVNLSEALLSRAYLMRAHLTNGNLERVEARKADFSHADLSRAILKYADLRKASIEQADLQGTDLNSAILQEITAREANLEEANLEYADLCEANFRAAKLCKANLHGARLVGAILHEANLMQANMTMADLQRSVFVETNCQEANFSGCHVFGISAWNVNISGAKQHNLIVTPRDEPAITADNLEVAQFIHLLVNNAKIRHVIDSVTSKVVLILGRFTNDRKLVLDALRERLRHYDYLPVLFDFEAPINKDMTATVETLARMARFIIADLTDPRSIPHELATIVPHLRTTPVQPLRHGDSDVYSMFDDLRAYPWVLPTFSYQDQKELLTRIEDKVISPAANKAEELRKTIRPG
jgi:uncharacterized protein YjbI with pentapeptide repeats